MAMFLVHFKSRDLTRLHAQGQFWHIFFTGGPVIISQDEVETWTVHTPVPFDTNIDELDAHEAVYKALGGHGEPYPIKIDEIIVKSTWRPNMAVADDYRSKGGRVFLAGDSAHQNIPTGGYGMNMGLADAYDIGWKLAAVLNGWGGEQLLKSYTLERRPVALRNVDVSGAHMGVHFKTWDWTKELGAEKIYAATEETLQTKAKIKEHMLANDAENKSYGLELDYRFPDSPIVLGASGEVEKPWSQTEYHPSTTPGSRAPHVFLSDGKTSTIDLYGLEYTILDFTKSGDFSEKFVAVAKALGLPLERRHLPNEDHVRKVWERDVVLVRPDGFVSWRSPEAASSIPDEEVKSILNVATGKLAAPATNEHFKVADPSTDGTTFTLSGGNVDMDKPEDIALLAEFQK